LARYDTDKEYPPPLGDVAAGVAKDLGIRRERYLVFNYADRFSEGLLNLLGLTSMGELKYKETFVHGLENAPEAFCSMMKGANMGKMVSHSCSSIF